MAAACVCGVEAAAEGSCWLPAPLAAAGWRLPGVAAPRPFRQRAGGDVYRPVPQVASAVPPWSSRTRSRRQQQRRLRRSASAPDAARQPRRWLACRPRRGRRRQRAAAGGAGAGCVSRPAGSRAAAPAAIGKKHTVLRSPVQAARCQGTSNVTTQSPAHRSPRPAVKRGKPGGSEAACYRCICIRERDNEGGIGRRHAHCVGTRA